MRPCAARFADQFPRVAEPPSSRIVTVVGATATGKTALAVAIAQRRGDMELVNADSRQVLRGLRVATLTPTAADLQGVPAHLFAIAEPGRRFTVSDWMRLAQPCVAAIGARGNIACLVGGTGLYVRSLINGWTFGSVPANAERREAREATGREPGGIERLAVELARRDPVAAATIDLHNPRRVVRALEVADARSGEMGGVSGDATPRASVQIAVDVPRDVHEALVAARVDAMFAGGAVIDEVRAALGRGVTATVLDTAGIGYREALAVIAGTLDVAGARAAVTRRTLRYAKAQRTWFRGDPGTTWLRWERSPHEVLEQALDVISARWPAGGCGSPAKAGHAEPANRS